MKHLEIVAIALVVGTVAGCASAPTVSPLNFSPTPELGALRAEPNNGQCPVWIYRNNTSFHSLNPEQPYVFVNDLNAGTISIGQTYCLNLGPGRYHISVKEPVLFIPAFAAGSIVVEVTLGSTQYVRYSKDLGGIIPTGAVVGVTSNKKLEIVSKQAWEGRI